MPASRKYKLAALVLLATHLPHAGFAATGDVSFSVADKTVILTPDNVETLQETIDIHVHVEGQVSVPATAWSLVAQIVPQSNASGLVMFDPPAIVAGEPNLGPSSSNPFLDFDRDFGGRSYGFVQETSHELLSLAAYVAPTNGPPPTLDLHGNLTLPGGAGLVALPLSIPVDVRGDFVISIVEDGDVSSVAYSTGSGPEDVASHRSGTHIAGTVRVRAALPGDFDGDGDVDGEDFLIWQLNFITASDALFSDGDATGDGAVDGADFLVWQQNFGSSVAGTGSATLPEPASLLIALVVVTAGTRRYY